MRKVIVRRPRLSALDLLGPVAREHLFKTSPYSLLLYCTMLCNEINKLN